MSASHVLKNSKPHQVQMPEGASNAQSKAIPDKTEAEPTEMPIQRRIKTSQVKPASASTAVQAKAAKAMKVLKRRKDLQASQALKSAPSSKALAQAMAKNTPLNAGKRPVPTPSGAQEMPPPADSSFNPTVTMPMPVSRAVVPDHELWESDSPVMQRIILMRARNAQLSEQVQRLKKPA